MFRNQTSSPQLKKQRGSMLVIALFVIIVLAFLAYAMIRITNTSASANVYEVYGTRALNAANSGVEKALNDIFGPGNSGTSCPAAASLTNLSLGGTPEFAGCIVNVTCNSFTVTQTGFVHFQIESTANCSAGDFTTQRSVVVEARN
ncbi:hypothetical protein MHM98_13555 [Psychrobium sp. MM17-31]|uniref:pilus assembly PilX family protein n=1 Tax=Psychrobium sp. MM17-31 TaxID=2917758 RepID=UPI001EF58BED|nr:hypothetical protein [Psychrobium sp. MM17-31]MCG7532358.1 hypothetical protein [Psychrobium sp. MM17-31]